MSRSASRGSGRRPALSAEFPRISSAASSSTTLAFVHTVDGEPHYAFYDEGTAAREWTYRQGSIPFAEADAIHVGSTTLADVRAAGQTLALVEDARGATTISFDPNCRPDLIDDKAEYVRRMDRFAAMPENLASLVPARSAHGPLPIATANRMP